MGPRHSKAAAMIALAACASTGATDPGTDTATSTAAASTTTSTSAPDSADPSPSTAAGSGSEDSGDPPGTSDPSSSSGDIDLPPTALQIAAEALEPGEHTFFPTVNTLQAAQDIQWNNRTIYYDAARRELQYMGKPASGQSQAYAHFIYIEESDAWVAPIPAPIPWPTGIGHIWEHTFDPVGGDYIMKPYGTGTHYLRYFDRSDPSETEYGTWKDTVAQVDPDLSAGNTPGPGPMYHPNLFGEGQPGVFYWGIFQPFAYDLTAQTWSVLSPASWDSGSPYRNRGSGNGVYLPAFDEAIMFAGSRESTDEPLIIAAGAGTSNDALGSGLVIPGADPPVEISGAGGDTIHGHAVNHPRDANRILILEEKGQGQVWESDDAARSWSGALSYTHPFDSMSNWSAGEWTCGVIARYDIIVGMTSNGDGGDFVLWKPPL